MRAIIFANGILNQPVSVPGLLQPGDLIIAADGGGRHCRALGLIPDAILGDLDSIDASDLAAFEGSGTQVVRYPVRKDYTDLELALRYARQRGAEEVLVLAALGLRWDQTLANMLLPASTDLAGLRISLIDGQQEIMLLRGEGRLEVRGQAGDRVSLIPLGGDALGITTQGLEYPLKHEDLYFGGTRGVSNVLLRDAAQVFLLQGLLLCVVIHGELEGE